MSKLINASLITLVTTGALCGAGCKRTASTDSAPTAAKQVEQAQQESKDAYDRAKQAQDKALDEQKQATKAQDAVNDKRQELAEAEAKAAKETQESQAAQAQAQQEGQAAQQQAQSAQQRAAQLEQQQVAEQQQSTPQTEPATGQARTADTHQVQTRSAPSQQQPASDFSWLKPGTWNSAPSGEATDSNAPAASTTTTSTDTTTTTDPVTSAVENTAMATVVKDAMTKSVSKSEIIITSSDDKSFHMVHAKLSPDTKVTRDGEAASINDIQAGDRVTVTYKMDHAQPVATKIEITSGATK